MKIGHTKKRKQIKKKKLREKLRGSITFFDVFFSIRNKEIKTKETRYFSKKRLKTKENSNMFLKIVHEKTI